MNIPVTIPDSSIPAWEAALEAYNGTSIAPLTLPEYIDQIIVGGQTNKNVAAYNSAQLARLAPLGEKYLAAPPEVQESIDEQLAPYQS